MDESDLRTVTFDSDAELGFLCAEVLAILEVRDHGLETFELNLVHVTVDCDKRTVKIQTHLEIDDWPIVETSIDQFVEVATPLAEPRSQARRDMLRRAREGRLREWPNPRPPGG